MIEVYMHSLLCLRVMALLYMYIYIYIYTVELCVVESRGLR